MADIATSGGVLLPNGPQPILLQPSRSPTPREQGKGIPKAEITTSVVGAPSPNGSKPILQPPLSPTPRAQGQGAEETSSSPVGSVGEDLGRTKRRRRQPPKDHDLDLDAEDMKILHQAIDNSRAENLNMDMQIEECPVFYPTIEEFVCPIKYISSIMPRAIRFGICRIVPPEGWENPTQVDFESKKKFATKLQRMSLMQEGRAMGDGQFYNVRQYEKMADEFRTKWIVEHHEDPAKVTYRDLESDYWKLIKGVSGEAVQVRDRAIAKSKRPSCL
jgi:hypothetical protein